MKRSNVVAGVIGSAALVLLATSATFEGVPAPSPGSIVAGNGPYSTFPAPPVTASALVSTSTSTTAVQANSAGH